MDGKVFVPEERIISRGQGCWNCIHAQPAREFWQKKRAEDLALATRISLNSPLGEKHPRVVKLRRMIDFVDHAVVANTMIRCTKGRTETGEPIGDLVVNSFLCDRWTGRDGASLAREGQGLDPLPMELRDKIDSSPEPKATVEQFEGIVPIVGESSGDKS